MSRILLLTGCPRSGTTALARLVNAHPQVAIGVERFKYCAPARMNRAMFERDYFFDFSEEQTNIVPRDYSQWGPYYSDMMKKYSHCVWRGDKNPGHINNFEVLEDRLEEPHWLIIVRDPLEVADSFERRARNRRDKWSPLNDYAFAVRAWNDFASKLRRARAIARDRLFVCFYHQLFAGHQRSLDNVNGFLGLAPSEAQNDFMAKMCANWSGRRLRPSTLAAGARTYITDRVDLDYYHSLLGERTVHDGEWSDGSPAPEDQMMSPPEADRKDDAIRWYDGV